MPWNPAQHRLFCAKCKDGKGPKQMCKMCHEGIKDDVQGQVMNDMVKKKAEKKK